MMAPLCVCGHRASEHHKQMGLRTHCEQIDGTAGGAFEESWDCPCTFYKPTNKLTEGTDG